jgi:hypothetical protein
MEILLWICTRKSNFMTMLCQWCSHSISQWVSYSKRLTYIFLCSYLCLWYYWTNQNLFSHFSIFFLQMGRSAGFNLGGSYSSHRAQQQQQHAPSVSNSGVSFSSVNNQDLHLHGSDIFPSSNSTYHSQVHGFPNVNETRHLLLCENTSLFFKLWYKVSIELKFHIPIKACLWRSYYFLFLV